MDGSRLLTPLNGGAQPKTALFFDGKRWGIPSGRRPTTHILKPGAAGLDGVARRLVRVHQEDICQALAVHPAQKYQSEGGPGAREVVELLRAHSREPTEDVLAFVDALAFSWLTAGTDAHAKNYLAAHRRGGPRASRAFV